MSVNNQTSHSTTDVGLAQRSGMELSGKRRFYLGPRLLTHDPIDFSSTSDKRGVIANLIHSLIDLLTTGTPRTRFDAKPMGKAQPMNTKRFQRTFERAVESFYKDVKTKTRIKTMDLHEEPISRNQSVLKKEKKARVKAMGWVHKKPVSLDLNVEESIYKPENVSTFHLENDRRLLIGVFSGESRDLWEGSKKTSTLAAGKFKKEFDQHLNMEIGNIELAFRAIIEDINKEAESHRDMAYGVISYLDKTSNRLYTATIGGGDIKINRSGTWIPLSLSNSQKLGSENRRKKNVPIMSIQVKPGDSIHLKAKPTMQFYRGELGEDETIFNVMKVKVAEKSQETEKSS